MTTEKSSSGLSDAARAKIVKDALSAADRLIKDKSFKEARDEVARAKTADPSNPYINAYLDKIQHFEEVHLQHAQYVKERKDPEKDATVEPRRAESAGPSQVPASPSAPNAAAEPELGGGQQGNAFALDTQFEEMRHQIEELSQALVQERKAREEIQTDQVMSSAITFRTALEKAWRYGAPRGSEAGDLVTLAQSLEMSPEVMQSLTREVKLKMYSVAVKEVLGRRKILRSSSNTLEWLRKVYQVSITEYLEYESQFLLDLVADQFRGTVLYITGDAEAREKLTPKLKGSGFAVVHAGTPESALEKIDYLSVNVILCDVTFRGNKVSGTRLLGVLRANPKYAIIPFILLCSPAEAEQLRSSELKSNEGIATKPIDFDDLFEQVNEKTNALREYLSSLG